MKNIEEILEELNGFSLEGDYLRRLGLLTDEISRLEHPESALPAMLDLLERFPEEEIGSPGPLIHTIEKCPNYEAALFQSLERQPASLTVWMVSRLLKYDPQESYVHALTKVLQHPKASEQTKEDAELILSWFQTY